MRNSRASSGIPAWKWIPVFAAFVSSFFISVVSGIALFGHEERGRYFIYAGSRIRGGHLEEVSHRTFVMCEIANWVFIALVAAYLAYIIYSGMRRQKV
ncbi:MAG: hypothetical protein ACXWKG_02320 [Limisphaerales bacterium]